jgi:SAM-dependent methyltransferase
VKLVSLVCPSCHAPLDRPHCGAPVSRENGIADFSGGAYYDTFHSEDELTAEHKIGLASEVAGSRWRIEKFYLQFLRPGDHVLDCGCGNGVSVDVLHEHGIDAWGVDLSALRKWQWRERQHRDQLAVANALRLPFPDDSFDVVISSGVIEHIGVDEIGGATYRVTPRADRDALRQQFIDELLRVTKRDGRVFVDCPNGAFPIDFWHGGAGGRARWHSRSEGFLPTFGAIRRMAKGHVVRAISPHRRFAFKQVGQHWYGRMFSAPMAMWFAAMNVMPLVARTGLNPYLVVEILKNRDGAVDRTTSFRAKARKLGGGP